MPRSYKIVAYILAAIVIISAGFAIAQLLDARNRRAGEPAATGGTTDTDSDTRAASMPLAVWMGPFTVFIVIYSQAQGEVWPVSCSLSALRTGTPERRRRGLAPYVSSRFSNTPKFAKFVAWSAPKGERTNVVSDGDARRVVATFGDGGEYTFTLVKRTKDNRQGFSAYVIDDVAGGEFDTDD